MGLRPKNRNSAAHDSFPVSVSQSEVHYSPSILGVISLGLKSWNIFFTLSGKRVDIHVHIPLAAEYVDTTDEGNWL